MSNRSKLIRAMHKADLSGYQQVFALIIHDRDGFDDAMVYVNQVMIDDRLGVAK